MSSINVLNIKVLNAVSKFSDSFLFELTFECLSALKGELEWKVTYIGSAEDLKYDQELESVIISPLQVGTMKFELEAPSPNVKLIPQGDLIGITAILICGAYNNQEFFRCGYYLNIFYDNEEMTINPPEKIAINRIMKSVLAEKPRITKFIIDWDVEDILSENAKKGKGCGEEKYISSILNPMGSESESVNTNTNTNV